jgi:hypothetical protein
MTGRKWTDAAQEAWLKLKFPAFLQADSTSTRKKFFGDVCVEWQKKWPDPEPTASELAGASGNREAAMTQKRKMKDKVRDVENSSKDLYLHTNPASSKSELGLTIISVQPCQEATRKSRASAGVEPS